MKVAYVARHQPHGNDDEGAVAFALEQLGHEVLRIEEVEAMAWVATVWRICGGTASVTASTAIPLAANAFREVKVAGVAVSSVSRPGSTRATSSNVFPAAMAGRCSSVAILPAPMMASLIGMGVLS